MPGKCEEIGLCEPSSGMFTLRSLHEPTHDECTVVRSASSLLVDQSLTEGEHKNLEQIKMIDVEKNIEGNLDSNTPIIEKKTLENM